MALFRRLFYRKPPDRLLEISENVFVFDCCFSADAMEEDDFKVYMDNIVAQLQDYFPEASFMVFNFREGDRRSQISDILSEYNMTVTDYPLQYGGCPLLPLEMIHHFFQLSERCLSSEGQQNVLLIHCERGGWPVLAFMLAGLLLYRKQFSGEQKTLEMLYKQAPRDLLKLLSPLNSQPSHLRYLHYISRRNLSTDWPPADTPRFLDCIILRVLPPFEGGDGCRPVIHVYGMDPKTPANRSCKLLFSTSKSEKQVRYFQKEECASVKIDTHCHIHGDVVLECVHLNEDLVHEEMIFRIMFHTAFVRQNILIFNHNDVDVLWDVRDQFPKEFSAEVNFMDPDAVVPRLTRVATSEDGNEIESGSPDEFFEVEEIFSNAVETLDGKLDDDSLAVHDNKLGKKDVLREDIDPHRFQECAKNDGNKKQDVVKDIAVDDVNYKLHKKMNSNTNAVKDITVDEGNIKVGSVDFSIDSLRDRETKVVTEDALGKLEDIDDSVNREDIVPLKRQRLTSDISRLKPENLPPASKKRGRLSPKPASESSLVKPKSKQLEPHGHPARQAKPNAISRWIPPNKGSFENSMHVSYPPSRHGGAPPALSRTTNLRKSKSGSNLKVSTGAVISNDVLFRQKSLNVYITKPLKDVSLEQKGQKVNHVKASDSPKEIFTTPRAISVLPGLDQSVHIPPSTPKSSLPPAPPPSPPAPRPSLLVSQSLQENTTSILLSLSSGDVSRMPFSTSPPSPPTSPPCTTENVHNTTTLKENTTSILPSLPSGDVSRMPFATSHPSPPPTSQPCTTSNVHNTTSLQENTTSILPSLSSGNVSRMTFAASHPCSPPTSPPCTTTNVHNTGMVSQSPVADPPPLSPSTPLSYSQTTTLVLLPTTPSSSRKSRYFSASCTVLHSPSPSSIPPHPSSIGSLCTSKPGNISSSHAQLLPTTPIQCAISPPVMHEVLSTPLSLTPSSCDSLSPPPFSLPPPVPTGHGPLPPPCLPPLLPPQYRALAPLLPPMPLHQVASSPPPLPPPFLHGAMYGHSPPPLQIPCCPSSPTKLHQLISATLPLPPPPLLMSIAPTPLAPSPLVSSAPNPSPPPSTSSALPSPPPLSKSSTPLLPSPPPPLSMTSTLSQSPAPPSMSKTPISSSPSPPSSTTTAPLPPPPFAPPSLVSIAPPPPLPLVSTSPPSPPSSMTGDAPPPPPLTSNTTSPPLSPQLLEVPASLVHGIEASSSSPIHRAPPSPPQPPGGGAPPPPPPPGGQTPSPPAPPGAPGVGPPPPPPGVRGRGRGPSRLGAISTTRKPSLKPLHWSKVSRAMKGSLWEELQRHGEPHIAPEFDVSELETLFSAVVPKCAGGGKGKGKSGGSKADKVHLIDLRRANNTEIMLTKVKMPLSDMMAAVLTMDDTVLDVDQVENLIKFCPTKEEVELLKNYTGDKENLGKCEQYFLELMKVPRVESKMRVFSFKIQFRTQISEFRRSLETVNSACDEVRNSDKLKELMKKILYLGNTLNQGTARGSAVGFKLDSLLKLKDTRASTSKMTLMHYLCKALAEKKPELLDFHLEFARLEAAAKIQLKALAEEMQAIVKGLEKVKQELAASENDGPVSDVFRKTLKEFVSGAEADTTSVTSLDSEVSKNAESLALYFGEDPVRCPFEQVTSTLLNFVRLFRKAHEENMKQAEIEQKQAEMEKKKAEEAETDKGKGEQEAE